MVFYVVKIEKHEAYSIKASLVEDPLPFSNLQCNVKEWYKNYNCVIGIGFILAVHLFYPDDKSVSIIDKVVEVFLRPILSGILCFSTKLTAIDCYLQHKSME